MPFVFSTWNIVICILCMDFAMAMQVLLLRNIEDVTPKGEFCLEAYLHVFNRHCVTMVVFQALLCSLNGRRYERVTHERTFLRWFRVVHVCPLIEWPLALVYHVCRCGSSVRCSQRTGALTSQDNTSCGLRKVLGNLRTNTTAVRVFFVVQFNDFMSLTSYFDVKYRY